MTDTDIIIYSLSTCAHCKETIRYIAEKGVKYTSIDIDLLERKERKQLLSEIKQINPERTFPTTKIGGKTIIGFEPEQIDEALHL